MSDSGSRAELDSCVDAIESAYEYFLAYAAQGRSSDRDAEQLRIHLRAMLSALTRLGAVVQDCAMENDPALTNTADKFFEAVERDAATAAGALQLVLAQSDISSQLIDNLNASIHVRAVLTDLFIVDEALKVRAQ